MPGYVSPERSPGMPNKLGMPPDKNRTTCFLGFARDDEHLLRRLPRHFQLIQDFGNYLVCADAFYFGVGAQDETVAQY